jgi:DNA-binding NtrC family response regulator
MARIELLIADPTQRVTIQAILESENHTLVDQNPDICLMDLHLWTSPSSKSCPTIVFTPLSQITEAVKAMEEGAWGYVVEPLQPKEIPLTIQRALSSDKPSGAVSEEIRLLEDVELDYILSVLKKVKNNQAKAARLLGIGRNTLWRKLKKQQDLQRHHE